jgi:uroporphyrinogen-III synthase
LTVQVIVTRPAREAQAWVQHLQDAGFDVTSLPLIDIAGPPDPRSVDQAWNELPTYDAVMFVSGNAVDYFFASKAALAPVGTAQPAIKLRALVTGPGSYAALQRAGVDPALIDAPDAQQGQFDSEALWAVMGHRVGPGYRVLVVRGTTVTPHKVHNNGGDTDAGNDAGVGRDWFSKQVLAAGGHVAFVIAYQRRCPTRTPAVQASIQTAIAGNAVWLFSSSEAVANLVALAPYHDWHGHRAVCTHARIAQAASTAGFGVVCESRPILAAVVASIESLP